MYLAENVKFLRDKNGWTQQELADRVGRRQSTIYKIESGDIAHPRILSKLAQVFNISEISLNYEDLRTHGVGAHGQPQGLASDIAVRLIEARATGHLTQKELADRLGISETELKEIETQKRALSLDIIVRLAALGLDMNYILSGQRLPEAAQNQEAAAAQASMPLLQVATVNGQNNIGIIEQNKEKKASS